METLHPGITPHHDCFLQPQKPDILPGGQEIKLATGTMISLSIKIRCQISSHFRNEDNPVGHTLQATRFHSRGGHGQQEHNDATGLTIRKPH